MEFEVIQKNSTPQMAAGQILDRIKRGELTAGSRLPAQRELAGLLGVGRSSIREAIYALVVLGYLEVRHGSGTYVRRNLSGLDTSVRQLAAAFEAVSLLDLMEAREILECRSAALAAQRADQTHIRRLQRILKNVEATHDNYGIFLQADLELHACLAETTGNAVLEEMTKLVLDKVVQQHQELPMDRLPPRYRARSIHSARKIVEAVQAGNSAAAARWMRKHLQAIRNELKKLIQ